MDVTGIGAIADLAKGIVDKIWPDKTQAEKEQAALQMQLAMQAFQLQQGQISTNTAEATNQSTFVAGWRPFVGWVCGAGFAVQFVVGPIGQWAAQIATGHLYPFPALDVGTLLTLLGGMLGLGTMRTVEKVNGVNAGH